MTSFIVVCTIAVTAATGPYATHQKMVATRSVAACQEWASQNSGKVETWIKYQLPLYTNRYETLCGPDGVDCVHPEPNL